MNLFTRSLTPEQQERALQHMKETVYEARPVDHALRAVRRPGLNIVLYKSGKLVAQGKGVTEWIEFVWEPLIAGEVESSATASPAPVASPLPRIGIDESGKGDFFGPMVIAGFVLTEREVDLLDTLGVRDSKQIKSADKIQRIATALLQHAPSQCEVICLQPETYNRMVGRMGSVNRVLAWGHATVLENLLERFPQISHAVADQFGPEHQIRSALKTRGAAITLEQRHRAESDPAVAAASILARQRFVEEMDSLSQQTAATLPRGATHVRKSAEELVQRIGPEILTRTAKIHFRTTRQVLEACGYEPGLLGTPEPKPFKRSN